MIRIRGWCVRNQESAVVPLAGQRTLREPEKGRD